LSLGCGVAPRDADALRRSFPEQADAVLRSIDPRADRAPFGTRAELPEHGEGPVRFAMPDGAEVEVRELGVWGARTSAEGAAAYARQGGASFWSLAGVSVEEWLWLDADAVRRDVPVAVWEVTGAALQEQGEAVLVVDGRGAAAMQVTAPAAYALGGRP